MIDPSSIRTRIHEHLSLTQIVHDQLAERCAEVASTLEECLHRGNAVFWCGNGGSASDAQHLAAELVGRFSRERRALPSIALNTNTSTLTSVSNDYGYEEVFARQVQALVRRGDCLVGLSTSGNSENVIRAVQAANAQGAHTVGLLGREGGRLASLCGQAITVPGQDTARIQEMHILIGHIFCDLIEESFVS